MNHLVAVLLTLLAMYPMPASSGPQRLFISGHSLVDQPLPSNLQAIAESLGTPIQWNRQYKLGSSIRDRSRGTKSTREQVVWDGYQEGFNRNGEGMNVLREWRSPATVIGGLYDTLLITEQHNLLATLWWSDTVRHLRHYHDQFVVANPSAQTWFFESWLGINDKTDPSTWIAYERAASPMWRCLVSRINLSLAGEGRPDRIESLPAGLALAHLIERAAFGHGVPSVSGRTIRETLDRILADDVHLTPLGAYYISLVTFAYLFDRAPLGAWAPDSVDELAARSLQEIAWAAVQSERAARQAWTLEQCRTTMQRGFNFRYWYYVSGSAWTQRDGKLKAYAESVSGSVRTFKRLRPDSADNPLRYVPQSDRDFWLAPP